ncbi:hypothetical protein, partial [Nostoc sp.]|uniref:hypothetical protein n=1 Tax=Nostoc sp. TaxID=1180 RepID=UPI002FF98818
MQIIQSPLGNNVHPLGVISSLSHPHRMGLRKESHSLHSRSNFISTIQTKPSLVRSSKFLLPNEHEASIQPLIGWDSGDTQDINSEFPLLEFDSLDAIGPQEKSNIKSNESGKGNITDIQPNRIDNNLNNEISTEINIPSKSKSKKTNKSQKPPEKKTKSTSRTKKAVKSSATKNIEQVVDENKITINRKEDRLLANTNSNLEAITAIEPDLILKSTANDLVTDNAVVDNSLTLSSALTSPDVDDAPTLLNPLANDENSVGAHSYAPLLHVAVPNSESSVAKSPIAIQQEIDSSVTSESPASAPVQLTPTSANIRATSPEIGEAPLITATSPEIGETAIAPKVTATSPEIGEAPLITATSPEIGENAIAPKVTATSPEIVEA